MASLPASTTLLCTDGSELAISALREGLDLLAPADRTVLLTVAPPVDPTLVTGTGFAGGVMSIDDKNDLVEAQRESATAILDETATALGLTDPERLVEFGDPGHVICEVAERLPAAVVVLGTHGRGGIKRAIIGSTSDHVVRHCQCPVLVQGAG